MKLIPLRVDLGGWKQLPQVPFRSFRRFDPATFRLNKSTINIRPEIERRHLLSCSPAVDTAERVHVLITIGACSVCASRSSDKSLCWRADGSERSTSWARLRLQWPTFESFHDAHWPCARVAFHSVIQLPENLENSRLRPAAVRLFLQPPGGTLAQSEPGTWILWAWLIVRKIQDHFLSSKEFICC